MTDIAQHPSYVIGTWKADAAHSEVAFSVRHLAIAKVRGTFHDFDITVVTPENPADITVEAVIDVATVDTRNETRDNHLRTGDFFLVEEHPQMTYRSTSVALDGEELTVDGELTLRGVTRPVRLKGEFTGPITDPYGATKAGATVTTKIDRKDFGMTFNMPVDGGGVLVSDEVRIDIDLELALQA